jgi:hypothetical protein
MCPVCRARFRGARECSRCGADLTVLMVLAAGAWRLRQQARQALVEGDAGRACTLASRAQKLCRTPAGARLESLGRWLAGGMLSRPSVKGGWELSHGH